MYYDVNDGFGGFAASTAAGGARSAGGSADAGYVGTVGFVDRSVPNSHLHVYGNFVLTGDSNGLGGLTIAGGTLSVPAGSVLAVDGDFALGEGATMTCGGGAVLRAGGTVTVAGNSLVTGYGANTSAMVEDEWRGVGVTLEVSNLVVEAGSRLSADAQGYRGGSPGDGKGLGGGVGTTSYAGGGAHGGNGGTRGAAGGTAYGSADRPTDLGSGGGAESNNSAYGGHGGSAWRIIAWGTLTLNGAISASGGDGSGGSSGDAGGGGGGGIWIDVDRMTGDGWLEADGGDANYTGGGGGGGRVAVYCWSENAWDTNNVGVAAGAGGVGTGEGTFVLGRMRASWWLQPEIRRLSPGGDALTLHLDYLRRGWTSWVERCSDLAVGDWATVYNVTSGNSHVDWTDETAGTRPGGYYRIRAAQVE